jgi:hypothetical protein
MAVDGDEVIVGEVVVEEVIFEEPSAPGPGTGTTKEAAAPPRPSCSFAFCPICMALTAVGEAKPELMEHLLVASREALLAIRSIIDARLEGSSAEPPTRLERLTID